MKKKTVIELSFLLAGVGSGIAVALHDWFALAGWFSLFCMTMNAKYAQEL